MIPLTLIAVALVAVLLLRLFLRRRPERCPDCNRPRVDDHPICACGWVFEYPEDDEPLEYGAPSPEEVDP